MNYALIGKMRSGKTTFAQMLVRKGGYTKLAFADQLKDDCLHMLNTVATDRLSLEEMQTHKEIFRPLLQWYGTDFWREYMGEENHWIDTLVNKIKASPEKKFVVDDCRFQNEALALRELGFTVIRLDRPIAQRFSGHLDETMIVQSHLSELESESIRADYTINNDQDTIYLEQLAEAFIQNV